MSSHKSETWMFIVEWYDSMPQLRRKYNLKYFPDSHSVEMIDLNTKKVFLKKSAITPEISSTDFVIGGKVIIYGRELDIVDFGDIQTKQLLQHQMQQVLVILSFKYFDRWGIILSSLEKNDLNILKMKSVTVTDILVDQIAEELQDKHTFDILPSNGMCLAVLLQGEEGINKVQDVKYLHSNENGSELIATTSDKVTTSLVDLIFNSHRISTATYDSCTCCIIKPHAVKDKLCGEVMDMILGAGFEISAVESMFFDRNKADEFLEVYKGVIPEYSDQALQLSNGLCIALELRGQDAVNMFRRLAGPWDINIAKELYPYSIRGKYGLDKIRSVVHCTDLEEDAQLECQYCFRIMI